MDNLALLKSDPVYTVVETGRKERAPRTRRLTREKREWLLGYAMVLPTTLILVLVGIIPVFITIGYSFQYRLLTDPLNIHFAGLENYITILRSGRFAESLRNTIVFTLLSLVVEFVVGFAGALLMNGAKRHVGIVRTIVLIPWAIPGIITAYMFSFMFNDQLGVINAILQYFHLIDGNVSFLTNRWLATMVVVLADTWKQFPFISLMLLSGLQTIPEELYESASVDGAGKLSSFFRITLPNLRGIILIVLLFRTMGALRLFDIVYGITGGGPGNATVTLLYQAYKYLFGDMNFGMGAAMSTIITLIILLFSLLYGKLLGGSE